VGQWNNDEARYEITDRIAKNDGMTDQQFEEHMRQLIASGAAFTFV
jgi:hypothetical protein